MEVNNNSESHGFIDYSKKEEIYSDGDVENEIIKILSAKDHSDKIRQLLANNPSWPILYHFSPIRKNLLSWFEFKRNSNLLEIGAGCGALTSLFCEKLSRVVAIELTRKRAEIIAKRYPEVKNLKIYAGNLNDIKIREKFDYITLIGVLEYAGKYTHTDNPFLDFLINIKNYLTDSGILIVAIENKFGIKYWAGGREDHTGKLFDSLQGYPEESSIQTFGGTEIKEMLNLAGFNKLDFYYPLPDYKFPKEIFSDNYLPTIKHNVGHTIFPTQDLSREREYIFNEKLVIDNIIRNKMFDFFANSFLIFAEK